MALWDADFYVKVDDDVHLNLGTLLSSISIPLKSPKIVERSIDYLLTGVKYAGMLIATLGRHKLKPRVYIGCMKSGPVLSDK